MLLSLVAVAAIQADEPGREQPLALDQAFRRALEQDYLIRAARPDRLHQTPARVLAENSSVQTSHELCCQAAACSACCAWLGQAVASS